LPEKPATAEQYQRVKCNVEDICISKCNLRQRDKTGVSLWLKLVTGGCILFSLTGLPGFRNHIVTLAGLLREVVLA